MMKSKVAATPINMNEKFVTYDGTLMADARKYSSLVWRLIYLTHARPDLAFPFCFNLKVHAQSNEATFLQQLKEYFVM